MAADDPRPDPLVLPDDELTAVRHLADAARAADAAYKIAAARVVLYEFLHQYGRSELPAFKVALDLASSLRKIIDDLGEVRLADPLVMPQDEFAVVARAWQAWVDGPAREVFDRVIQEVAEDAAAPWQAKLSAIEAHCRTHPELAGAGYPQLASDILVIIGAGEPQERSDDKEGRRP